MRRFVGIADADLARNSYGDVVRRDWWEAQTIDARWMCAARFVYQGADLVIGELRIFPREQVADWNIPGQERAAGIWSAELLGHGARAPRGGLGARTLRKVHLREIAEVVRRNLEATARSAPQVFEPGHMYGDSGIKKPDERPRPVRRTGRSDHFYAALAAQYVRALAHNSRRPVAWLAEKRKLKKEQVRDMLHEARRREILAPGIQGRAGGVLTSRGRELLGARRARK